MRHRPSGLLCPADLVIADIPYFGTCNGVYSDDPLDFGNMDLDEYTRSVRGMAVFCAKALKPGGRVVIITAQHYVDRSFSPPASGISISW